MRLPRSSPDPEQTGLVWFRTGLRLRDNAPLHAALRDNSEVACLYVLDDHYLRGPDIGPARAAFLLDSLAALDASLRAHGGRLMVRRTSGDAPGAVLRAARDVGAGRIYCAADYLPYPIRRDKAVAVLASAEGRELVVVPDLLLAEPADVLTNEGRPYSVFSPFKQKWASTLSVPNRFETEPLLGRLRVFPNAASAPLPALDEYGLTLTQQIDTGGEARATARLEQFLSDGLPEYHNRRDFAANPDATSRLSMHIKWGTVSIRDCYREARKVGGPGAEKWIDELAWREFFHAIVFHFPHVLDGPMRPEYSDFPWSENAEHLAAWRAGETGYPFVDAGMRQLKATGWMHNRLRQVTASYLVKDLAIHWQEGERWFMQMLVDGDWPANNGNWQWVAGCGTDPRRATRIFNPELQRERYDPDWEYVRQWAPEFGTDRYPNPIVPHAAGRAQFLERFRAMRR